MMATRLTWESAIRRGGAIGAAKGLSLVRRALRATIMAVGGSLGVVVKVVWRSSSERGYPRRCKLFIRLRM